MAVSRATPAAAQAMPAIIQVAVFDYDGTAINGQSGALFARYLFARGLLSPLRALRLGWWGIRYVLHLPCRQGEAREQIFDTLREHSSQEVKEIMCDFHDQVLSRRYRQEALNEVCRRKEEGCVTLLVSATFRDIAEQAARRLGVDGLVATDMERDAQGNYTGNVEGAVVAGPEKTRAVRRWANEHLGPGTWEIAYSYGDHHSDEDLLSVSKQAFAVSPGKALRRKAKQMNWVVLDWS
ncbi:MAG: HAD family hydrolase [Olsenella profusa]